MKTFNLSKILIIIATIMYVVKNLQNGTIQNNFSEPEWHHLLMFIGIVMYLSPCIEIYEIKVKKYLRKNKSK